jgi:hypothetical protein
MLDSTETLLKNITAQSDFKISADNAQEFIELCDKAVSKDQDSEVRGINSRVSAVFTAFPHRVSTKSISYSQFKNVNGVVSMLFLFFRHPSKTRP